MAEVLEERNTRGYLPAYWGCCCCNRGSRMLKRVLPLTALLVVIALLVILVARATAGDCGRLTLSIDGTPQSCGTVQPADTFGTQRVRSYLFSGLDLTGSLLTSAGAPSVGTAVTVQSSALDGSGPASVASGTTDARGHYAITVPRGSSRLLTVAAAGNSLMVRELVAPNVFLKVHARRGAVLILWGRVLTAGPALTVVLQDRAPQGWQTFGVCAPDALGRYRYVYKSAPATVGYRFAFRATTMPTLAWQAGTSGSRNATIRE